MKSAIVVGIVLFVVATWGTLAATAGVWLADTLGYGIAVFGLAVGGGMCFVSAAITHDVGLARKTFQRVCKVIGTLLFLVAFVAAVMAGERGGARQSLGLGMAGLGVALAGGLCFLSAAITHRKEP